MTMDATAPCLACPHPVVLAEPHVAVRAQQQTSRRGWAKFLGHPEVLGHAHTACAARVRVVAAEVVGVAS